MSAWIGGILVPCSEWWPGRVKFISLQKPSTLSVHYWIPVLRVAVAFQQCTGSWPALCTLGIAPKGRKRRGWVVYHWFLLCIVATLPSHCAMRIAEVWHFFPNYSRWGCFWHVVLSLGEGLTCKVQLFTLLWMFSRKLSCTTYWRNAFIYWKPTVFAVKTCPFSPHMDIQANSLMRIQKIILRAWKMFRKHYNRSTVSSQLGLSYP